MSNESYKMCKNCEEKQFQDKKMKFIWKCKVLIPCPRKILASRVENTLWEKGRCLKSEFSEK
jgi:hypothetical protein